MGTVVGGVIGAVVGFYAGGNVALGWQIGAAAGGAIGGYVDPDVIKGPKLTDPQKQTSAEGVPRPIVYGTAAVFGNVIQVQSVPTEHKKKKRTGKGGGPVQETYTYTRTAAIRICEAAPLSGEMMLRRVWMNGKLAMDRTGTGTIDAESAKLLGELTFYSGAEDQLPDPDLEALPAGDGGGVGNVPAYRGTCYVVLRNVDVTNGGALPQFMWEVTSAATESGGDCTQDVEWLAIKVGGTTGGGDLKSSIGGEDWSSDGTSVPLAEGGAWAPNGRTEILYHAGELLGVSSSSGFGGASTAFRDSSGVWHQVTIESSLSSSSGQLSNSGAAWFIAAHAPGPSQISATGTAFTDGPHSMEDIAKAGDKMVGVYATGASYDLILVYRFNLDGTADGAQPNLNVGYQARRASLGSDGTTVLMAVADESSAGGGDQRVQLHSSADQGSTWTAHGYVMQIASAGLVPFVHHSSGLGRWFVYCEGENRIAHGTDTSGIALDSFVFPEAINGIDDDGVKAIVCGENGMLYSWAEGAGWVALDSHTDGDILDVVALGSALFIPPAGSVELPDSPGHYVTPDGDIVGCGAGSITPNAVYLGDIVADQCDRSGVSDYDVSAISAIEVRGLAITAQVDAAGVIQSLQQVHPFSFPEWGNSGDTGTKLRAVLLGGSAVATIADDDLLETDDEETVRRQQVEFPRKVTLFAPDPDANYEATPQTAERESENVKATGEVSISTAVVLSRGEKAQVVDIAHKVLWEEANGTAKFELPEEFTRLVPSDPVIYDGRRYRINRVELGDGMVTVEGVRDRASAYTSNATANDTVDLPPTQSGLRGPTMMHAMNLPSLRTSDNVPGMYIGVCGRLAGWVGCDLYLSVDGGVSEQLVATIIDPATMGYLTAGVAAAGEPISIKLYNDDELDSVTAAQLAARMNAAAVTTAEVSEVLQFQTPTDTGDREYDLNDLSRGQLGTIAAEHVTGDPIVILDGSEVFLPIDISHSGKTLIFRPVSRGTIPENNLTYSFLYSPLFTSVTVSPITVGGEQITVSGQPIYVVNQNA